MKNDHLLLSVLLSAAIVSSIVSAQDTVNFTLKILHINDHHSHLEQETFTLEDLPVGVAAQDDKIDVTYGGFPRLTTLFGDLHAQAEAEGMSVLKLHAGDALAGTLYYTLYKGQADAALMKFICFDAITLGNHEWDDSDANLADFISSFRQNTDEFCNTTTQILSANYVPAPDSPMRALLDQDSIAPYYITDDQVGVIGITTPSTLFTSSPLIGTNFTDSVTATKTAVAELEAQGINKIIALTHIGYEEDIAGIAAIEGVDVVVGGHSHSLLGAEESLGVLSAVSGPYPTVEAINRQNSASVACVVQAWENGHGLGSLTVKFDAIGEVLDCSGGPIFPFDATTFDPPLDANAATAVTSYLEGIGSFRAVEPNTDAAAVLNGFEGEVAERAMEVVAFVPEPGICFERIPGEGRSKICSPEETAMFGGGVCNLVAQAFLDQALTADVAIQNGGGCRTDIFPGNYTIADAFTLLPFSNTLVTIEMTGSEIDIVLNQAVDFALNGGSTGAYPYAAGLRYKVDANEGFPNYIYDLQVNSRLENEWELVDPNAVYTVVTNNFIAAGRDGYFLFGEIDESFITNLFFEYAQTFINFAIQEKTLLDPPVATYSTQLYTPLAQQEAIVEAPTMSPPSKGPVSAPMEDTSLFNGPGATPAADISSVIYRGSTQACIVLSAFVGLVIPLI